MVCYPRNLFYLCWRFMGLFIRSSIISYELAQYIALSRGFYDSVHGRCVGGLLSWSIIIDFVRQRASVAQLRAQAFVSLVMVRRSVLGPPDRFERTAVHLGALPGSSVC